MVNLSHRNQFRDDQTLITDQISAIKQARGHTTYLFLFALKRISSMVAFNDPDSSSLRISLSRTDCHSGQRGGFSSSFARKERKVRGEEHTMFFRSLLPSAWSARVRHPSPRRLRGDQRRCAALREYQGSSGEMRDFRGDEGDCGKKRGVRGGLRGTLRGVRRAEEAQGQPRKAE